MSKIRILLVLHDLSRTGAPKIALDALERMGNAVSVRTIALKRGPLEGRCLALGPLQLLFDPAETFATNPFLERQRQLLLRKTLPATLIPGFWIFFTQLLQWLLHKIWSAPLRNFRPDVIYVNSVASLSVARLLALPPAPVLLHVHELETVLALYTPKYGNLLRDWPDRYIAVSEPVRRTLVDDHCVDNNKIVLIHEFMNECELPTAAAVETSIPVPASNPGCFVVGGGGRVQWRKGTEMWLQMALRLVQILGREQVRFVWVGVENDTPERDFRATARKLKIDDLVEFVPMTTEPLKHYARFDVFALTSWEDPCPIVVLEAMMLEKPVVCFADSGGAPEEVGDTGVVIPTFCAEAMAEAIACLARAPARRIALGRAARNRAEQHFTAAVQVPKIHREFLTLCNKQSGTIAAVTSHDPQAPVSLR